LLLIELKTSTSVSLAASPSAIFVCYLLFIIG